MSLKPQKIINTRHQKKKTSAEFKGNDKFYEHDTKSLMNIRPQKLYEPKAAKKIWT